MSEYTLDAPVPRRPPECPVEDWLTFLGHRWNALLLWHLQAGRKRHSELVAALPGVSSKVLSERLLGLEMRGLLERCPQPVFPREVSYSLSPSGQSLLRILDQLEVWSYGVGESQATGNGGAVKPHAIFPMR
ncbi:MAG: helix-turn-helix transcriptional regulator [Acidovorax sp.]|jgi:DNA-binding HxlR family transcriptional regulator|nr:helix-turn-helix transcriptional regulator [Acidovorax sp.]